MDCLLPKASIQVIVWLQEGSQILDKPLSHKFYIIDLSGHQFEVLSISLLLWNLHPSALIFPGRVSKPQAVHPNQSVHTAPIISDGRITTSMQTCLVSRLTSWHFSLPSCGIRRALTEQKLRAVLQVNTRVKKYCIFLPLADNAFKLCLAPFS